MFPSKIGNVIQTMYTGSAPHLSARLSNHGRDTPCGCPGAGGHPTDWELRLPVLVGKFHYRRCTAKELICAPQAPLRRLRLGRRSLSVCIFTEEPSGARKFIS